MWTVFLLTGLIASQPPQGAGVGQAATGSTQQAETRLVAALQRPDPLELTLAAPVQLPSGRRVGAFVRQAAGPEPWFVYSRGNLCQSVITRGPAPTDAVEGWKVSVTQRSRTTSQIVVGVAWARMWERGRSVPSGSSGSNELTLQRGDRIPLDSITRPSEPGVCAGTTKTLELQVGVTTLSPEAPAGESPLDGVVDVELWMVHQAPNGAETVDHQIVRLMNGVIGFSFRGGPIETADGQVAIELSGLLKAVKREDGSRGLWASLTRGVTRLSTGTSSSAAPTTTTDAWPTSGEVVSLVLPPLQFYAGRTAIGGVGAGGGGAGTRTMAGGGQGGASAGAVPRSGGGAVVSGVSGRATPGPNLLEGHRLSLRVRLAESPR